MKGYISKSGVVMSNKQLKGFDYDEDKKDLPNLDFKTKLVIDTKDFIKTIKTFKLFKISSVIITSEDVEILFNGNEEFSNIKIILKTIFEKSEYLKGENETVKSQMSIDYLNDFIKSLDKKLIEEKEMTIYLDTDYPIKIEIGDLIYIQAPRVVD